MTPDPRAVEALLTAIGTEISGVPRRVAEAILAALPDDWPLTPPEDRQALADGRAMAALRRALPGHMIETYGPHPTHGGYLVQAIIHHGWDHRGPEARRVSSEGPTIAAACEAAQAALEGREGGVR